MSVSVLIVNWNSGPFLQKCLRILKNQTVSPEQIVIVDNGSTDDSIRCIESMNEPMISLLKLPENLGFAAANNLALAECKTEFVALLNPDAFPETNWLECLLTAAYENPTVAAFGSRQIDYYQPDILDGIGDNYHFSGMVWREAYGTAQTHGALHRREIFSACAAAALYRREALVNVGLFDADYFCYVEDVDLGFRLQLAGYKALYVPDAVVRHVGSVSAGGRNSDFYIYHGQRNLVWTFLKNMPGMLFWALLPIHILLNLVAIGWFSVRGKAKIVLRAKWDAVKGITKMWRKRRRIQGKRVASTRDLWRIFNKRLIPVVRPRLRDRP